MRYLAIITTFLFFPAIPAFTQVYLMMDRQDVDTLRKDLQTKQGTARVNALNLIAASLCFEDFTASLNYAREALSLSRELNYPEGEALAEKNLGYAFLFEGNYPEALNHYQEALNVSRAMGDLKLTATVLRDMATTHFYAGNVGKSKEIGLEAMATYRLKDARGESIGSVIDTMRLRSALGLALRNAGHPREALEIYLDYIRAGEMNNFEPADMLVHHGLVALCYSELGKYDSALVFLRKALVFPELNSSITTMNWEHRRRIGTIYNRLGMRDSAIIYLSGAFHMLSDRGFLMQSQMAARELWEIYEEKPDVDSAGFYLRNAEDLLDEMAGKGSFYRTDSLKYTLSWGRELFLPFTRKFMKEFIYSLATDTYGKMYRYFLGQSDMKAALHYLQKYSISKDSLVILSRNREFVEVQTKFETEAKEKQIEILTRDNQLKEARISQHRYLILGLSIMVISGAIAAVVMVRQNKLKHRQQNLELRQKLLRTQMNPHFLFNSLTSIQNFIIGQEPVQASDYLSRFSKLVRQILDNSFEEMISLEQEVEAVGHYLALQKVRYGNLFDYRLEVEETIDTERVKIPPMLAQPIIENAIEHGFKIKGVPGGVLTIRFTRSGQGIRLEVEDNGAGRQKAMELQARSGQQHRSVATDITKERIALFNRRSRKKISLQISDLHHDSGEPAGTRVVVWIPDLT